MSKLGAGSGLGTPGKSLEVLTPLVHDVFPPAGYQPLPVVWNNTAERASQNVSHIQTKVSNKMWKHSRSVILITNNRLRGK